MSQQTVDEEQGPPQGQVKIIYLGPTAPHWEIVGIMGDSRLIDGFRDRVMARLMLLPPHDPQFRRNRERVALDGDAVVAELKRPTPSTGGADVAAAVADLVRDMGMDVARIGIGAPGVIDG